MNASKNMISVVICCYNSEQLIKPTLEHLANQDTNKTFNYEVVLVDNNCKDHTVEVAKAVWNELDADINLNIVTESKPGLSYARETGVNHSNGDLIIFCDDDNWLKSDYLQIAFDFMSKHAEVGVLGGQSIGLLEGGAPNWWSKEATNYAVGEQAAKSGDITNRSYVWGAGMVFRKSLFLRLYNTGFESLLSDRKGELLSSGGDSELCKWFVLMGYKLWYLKSLKFMHYITTDRLTDNYLVRLLDGHKQAQPILNLYNRFIFLVKNNEEFKLSQAQKNNHLKKGIKGFLKHKNSWKESMQLAVGTLFKIDANLYQIIKTYKMLKATI